MHDVLKTTSVSTTPDRGAAANTGELQAAFTFACEQMIAYPATISVYSKVIMGPITRDHARAFYMCGKQVLPLLAAAAGLHTGRRRIMLQQMDTRSRA